MTIYIVHLRLSASQAAEEQQQGPWWPVHIYDGILPGDLCLQKEKISEIIYYVSLFGFMCHVIACAPIRVTLYSHFRSGRNLWFEIVSANAVSPWLFFLVEKSKSGFYFIEEKIVWVIPAIWLLFSRRFSVFSSRLLLLLLRSQKHRIYISHLYPLSRPTMQFYSDSFSCRYTAGIKLLKKTTTSYAQFPST